MLPKKSPNRRDIRGRTPQCPGALPRSPIRLGKRCLVKFDLTHGPCDPRLRGPPSWWQAPDEAASLSVAFASSLPIVVGFVPSTLWNFVESVSVVTGSMTKK
jgi:hypothetical protein